MGVLSKLKGIFYDEVIVDEPEEEIKKVDRIVSRPTREEPRIEKIQNDIEEELERKQEEKRKEESKKEENLFNERELFRSERTFNFTEFDDEDELPPKKNILNEEVRVQNNVDIKTSVPEHRVFKPTPVISPIYGILDKDYKKEEIKQKNEKSVSDPMTVKITNYDTVRRKAYGTLEDELEDTLNKVNTITTDTINVELTKEKTSKEPKKRTPTEKIEELINQIDDATDELDKTMSVGELEDSVELDNFEEEESKKEKKSLDNTLEHDLFNLIDSMYDDKED